VLVLLGQLTLVVVEVVLYRREVAPIQAVQVVLV
jgi:hypothetical protein